MVSYFPDCHTAEHPQSMCLLDWLRLRSEDLVWKVQYIRKIKDPVRRTAAKESLPAITPSGLFTYRSRESLAKHSGLICLDIDGKDNEGESLESLKATVTALPWVAYCGLSVSGNGLFALVPIAYPGRHLEHFRALQRDLFGIGVKIDPACSDVARLRFYSYDPNPYYNHEADTYETILEPERKAAPANTNDTPTDRTRRAVDDLVKQICRAGVDITGENKDWYNIGCSLAAEFGSEGRGYFHEVSQFYSNPTKGHRYDPEETEKMYDRCMKSADRYSIRTFFYYCGVKGIRIIEERREGIRQF